MARYIGNLGLSVQISNAIAPQGLFTDSSIFFSQQGYLYNYPFEERITAYSHTINADGGFESATITIAMGWSAGEIDDWINYGLGRDVRVVNNNGALVFEGFVNRTIINRGAYSISRGPLMDIGNRCQVLYTPIIDVSVEPPTTGEQMETTIAENEESQTSYGIIEKVLSGGQLIDGIVPGIGYINQANELRDIFLNEAKDPQLDQTINFTSPQEPSVTLEVRGYYDWLGAFIYNDLDSLSMTSYSSLTTKMVEVISYDTNGLLWYSLNPDSLEENPLLTPIGEYRYRTGKTVIEELVSMGDGFDNRWIFYVDEHRLCRYHPIPSVIDYKIRITDREQIVETLHGDRVYPWDVRPGKWAELDDFMTAGPIPTINQIYFPSTNVTALYFRTDPKNMFIESVQFTAPTTLTLTGGRIDRLKYRMAQLGSGT